MLAVVLLPTVVSAQVINGDLNHSGKLEVSDVSMVMLLILIMLTVPIAQVHSYMWHFNGTLVTL